MEEIRQSYANDTTIHHIIQELQHSPASHPHYTWVNNHLNRKGRVVIGHNDELRMKLIEMFHNSAIGGHSGMTVTSKIVGSLFY